MDAFRQFIVSAVRRPLQALSLLTRVPVKVKWDIGDRWGPIVGWFPLAGYATGGISLLTAWAWLRYGAAFGSAPWSYSNVAAAAIVAAGAWATGALHLDGWADFCDGCFVSAPRERRLAIMADPRLGAFGITGLALLLLAKYSALSSMLSMATLTGGAPLSILAAPVAARWAATIALSIRAVPLAVADGMAAKARDGLGAAQPLLATILLAPLFALSWRTAAYAAAAGIISAAALSLAAWRRIGGLNGDILGAIIEFSETIALAVTPC